MLWGPVPLTARGALRAVTTPARTCHPADPGVVLLGVPGPGLSPSLGAGGWGLLTALCSCGGSGSARRTWGRGGRLPLSRPHCARAVAFPVLPPCFGTWLGSGGLFSPWETCVWRWRGVGGCPRRSSKVWFLQQLPGEAPAVFGGPSGLRWSEAASALAGRSGPVACCWPRWWPLVTELRCPLWVSYSRPGPGRGWRCVSSVPLGKVTFALAAPVSSWGAVNSMSCGSRVSGVGGIEWGMGETTPGASSRPASQNSAQVPPGTRPHRALPGTSGRGPGTDSPSAPVPALSGIIGGGGGGGPGGTREGPASGQRAPGSDTSLGR